MRKLAALFVPPPPRTTFCLLLLVMLARAMMLRSAMLATKRQTCTPNRLKLFCFITLTSGIHLIARIRSPTLQRMSKRAFHMLKWAPSKHGTGAGFGLRIHQMFYIIISLHFCSDAQFILAHAYSRSPPHLNSSLSPAFAYSFCSPHRAPYSGFGVQQDSSQYMHYLQQAAMFGKHPCVV
jgi:hypothetical protein